MGFLSNLFKPNIKGMEAKREVRALLNVYLNHPNDLTRKEAFDAIVRIGSSAEHFLCLCLKDFQYREKQIEIGNLLGMVGGEEAVEAIFDVLEGLIIQKNNSWAVQPLVDILKKIGKNPKPYSILKKTYLPDLYYALADVMGAIAGKKDIDFLRDMLRYEQKYPKEIRPTLMTRLVENKNRVAIPLIFEQLKEQKNLSAHIKQLDDLGWKPKIDQDSLYYWYAKGKYDECIQVIRAKPEFILWLMSVAPTWAERALVEIGDPVVSILAEKLTDSTDQKIIQLLHKINWQPTNPTVAVYYYWGLRQLHNIPPIGKEAVEPLLKIFCNYSLRDVYDRPKREALYGILNEIKDPAVASGLIALFHSSSYASRLQQDVLFYDCVGRYHVPFVVDLLISCLDSWHGSDCDQLIAETLVKMYHADDLDQASKKKILANRMKIMQRKVSCGYGEDGSLLTYTISTDFPL